MWCSLPDKQSVLDLPPATGRRRETLLPQFQQPFYLTVMHGINLVDGSELADKSCTFIMIDKRFVVDYSVKPDHNRVFAIAVIVWVPL